MTWAGHMRAPPRQEWVQSSKIGLSTKNGVDPPHWSPSLSWASAFRMLQEQTRRLMWVLNVAGRASRGSRIWAQTICPIHFKFCTLRSGHLFVFGLNFRNQKNAVKVLMIGCPDSTKLTSALWVDRCKDHESISLGYSEPGLVWDLSGVLLNT